ncbi:hypothetical protein NDU88_002888 [Pleurodeles waltl]|uniref:Uncharacterized protein n=1 Tax=Pleurodeles waltl TaxID=8319 RepID=A0AAV7L2J2_PLEWA|nr:hypothetical protein NDU88_002888 [Pleurodeles waltl]
MVAVMQALNMSFFCRPHLFVVSLLFCALASSGGGAVAPEHEGAASHMAMEGHTTESDFTSGMEGEGSSTAGTGAETSDTDSSSDGSSLVVVATSVPPPIYSGACSHRNLECTGHQGSQGGTEAQHNSPPPVKHQKLASAWRDKGKTPITKAAPRGTGGSVESAATPSKVGKGHKKLSKAGKSSTAEKTAIIPTAQEATASTSPAAQEATASTTPAAQEATATSPAAQEATATSPAAQEATASTSPAAQEATAIIPAAQEPTAVIPDGTERTISTSPVGLERTASTSPTGLERTASTSPAGA